MRSRLPAVVLASCPSDFGLGLGMLLENCGKSFREDGFDSRWTARAAPLEMKSDLFFGSEGFSPSLKPIKSGLPRGRRNAGWSLLACRLRGGCRHDILGTSGSFGLQGAFVTWETGRGHAQVCLHKSSSPLVDLPWASTAAPQSSDTNDGSTDRVAECQCPWLSDSLPA